jgi:hypothetical protein
MNSTTPTTQKARKPHMCDWCWTRIESGEEYVRYRVYDGGDAGTIKEHRECYEAMQEAASEEPDNWIEFTPGDNPRGCNCGFEQGCERCAERQFEKDCDRCAEMATTTN